MTIRQTLWYVTVSGLFMTVAMLAAAFGLDGNRAHDVNSGDPVALIGSTRSEVEAVLGVPDFCADSWHRSDRESIRRGGLRMRHTQVVFSRADTHGNSHVEVWNSGSDLARFVERISSGDLRVHDFPLGIALERPRSLLIAQFSADGTIESTTTIRPSFVIIDP